MKSESQAIRYDRSGAFVPEFVTSDSFGEIESRLEDARREVVDDDANHYASGQVPPDKRPLDAGFFPLPERLLADYEGARETSELGRILSTANRLAEQVDRVVLLGIGGSYMGARALMEACCDPYRNEQTRGQRGGRPKLYFEGNNLDNDAASALLQLLRHSGESGGGPERRWGIIVISKSGSTIETAVAFRVFLETLADCCQNDTKTAAKLIVPVTGQNSDLHRLTQEVGCADDETFEVPDGVGGRFSVFSAVGLLPAAVLGLDVVELLRGAAAMNDHFRTAPVQENTVLQYVGMSHLWENAGADVRVLSVWSTALEAVGLWYDQLLSESLGKSERGATPLTAVNTRDLHSRAQQHQEGKRDKLITNLVIEDFRTDQLQVPRRDSDLDQLNDVAGMGYPQLLQAAVQGTNEAYQQDKRPTADLILPNTREHALGQLLQMLMLATVVEGRMIGVNPYGQPGVQLYKENMNRILGRGG